jgi:hypothetical protein
MAGESPTPSGQKLIEGKRRWQFQGDGTNSVHPQLPKGKGKVLTSQNLLKDCVDSPADCTQPIWISPGEWPSNLLSPPVMGPGADTTRCTGFAPNDKDKFVAVCVDEVTDELKYRSPDRFADSHAHRSVTDRQSRPKTCIRERRLPVHEKATPVSHCSGLPVSKLTIRTRRSSR